jgi:hypothetical protein
MPGKSMTKLIAMVAALGVGGCSFIGVRGPPSPLPEHGMVTCSDSNVAPIVDSVVAAIGVLALVAAAGPCNSDACTGNAGDGQGIGTRGLLVVTGVALAPFGISALYGYSRVSNCNEANRTQARREVAEDTTRTAALPPTTPAPSSKPPQQPPHSVVPGVYALACATECADELAQLTTYRDATGTIAIVTVQGSPQRCDHPPLRFLGPDGVQRAEIPMQPVVPGSFEAKRFDDISTGQIGNLTKAETAFCRDVKH